MYLEGFLFAVNQPPRDHDPSKKLYDLLKIRFDKSFCHMVGFFYLFLVITRKYYVVNSIYQMNMDFFAHIEVKEKS